MYYAETCPLYEALSLAIASGPDLLARALPVKFHALLHCRAKGDLTLLEQALSDVHTLPQPDQIGYYEILRRCLAPKVDFRSSSAAGCPPLRETARCNGKVNLRGSSFGRTVTLLPAMA